MSTLDEDRKLARDYAAYKNADSRAVTDALLSRCDEVERLRGLVSRLVEWVDCVEHAAECPVGSCTFNAPCSRCALKEEAREALK